MTDFPTISSPENLKVGGVGGVQVEEVEHAASDLKICVLGHPRCGTGFMSKVFQNNGFDVQHEQVGRNGTSNWTYVIPDKKCFSYCKYKFSQCDFDLEIAVIRDPLTAIPSIAFTETCESMLNVHYSQGFMFTSTMFRYKNTGIEINPEEHYFNRVVQSYVNWYKLIQSRVKHIIRLEYWQEDLKGLVDETKLPTLTFPKLEENMEKVNARKHSDFTGGDWSKIKLKYLLELEELTKPYYGSLLERIKDL